MKKKLILSISIFVIILSLVISPQKYILITKNAIEVWAKVLLPSLLPFFIFTRLLTALGYVQNASKVFGNITYKLYNCPPISGYVFFISIISGYPVGSKLVSDLYENGQITKLDAKKMITFTSNSGPMFIIGSVGIGMLASKKIGYILLLSHIIGAILNGLIYKNIKGDNTYQKTEKNIQYSQESLQSSVSNSITAIMLVGGMVIVAFIVIEILSSLQIFYPLTFVLSKIGINVEISSSLINGIFEITKGCLQASALNISNILKICMLAFVISFGGICTTLQAMAFLKEITSYKFFIMQKITHAIISTLVCAILCLTLAI